MTGSNAAKRLGIEHALERTYCRTRRKNAVAETTGASLSRKRARSTALRVGRAIPRSRLSFAMRPSSPDAAGRLCRFRESECAR